MGLTLAFLLWVQAPDYLHWSPNPNTNPTIVPQTPSVQADPLNEWANCIGKNAEILANISNEPAETIGVAAMGACGKHDAQFFTAQANLIGNGEQAREVWQAQRTRLHDMAVTKAILARVRPK